MTEERLHWRGASGQVEADLSVVIIRAGEANGRRFAAPLLAAQAGLFEGAPCFADHASALDATRPGGRSVRDLVGHVREAHWDAARAAVVGQLALLSQGRWVEALAREAGERAYLGLSADLWVREQEQEVTAIEQVCSVDIVINPAAGGRFLATLAQHGHGDSRVARGKEPMMDNALTEPTRVQTAQLPAPLPPDEAQTLRAQLLESKLAAARLPDALANTVRAQLEGRVPNASEMDAAILSQRAALAEAVAQTSIVGLGQVGGVVTPLEKITLALERLMGLPETAAHRDVAPLSGIRELYDLLSGDWERHGVFRRERVMSANATTSTMSNVVANVLNKVLLRSYEARAAWWKSLAAEYDFSTMNTARFVYLGGFPDLDNVAEGASYTEKSWSDNAETATFVKKGNYLGITLEMLDRDDVNAVRALPRRLAVAAQRTLSSAVATLFTTNSGVGPTLADSKALFHADHGNLGSTAFSANEWDAVIQAMWKQSELNSSKRLGVRPRWCLVPIELEKDALTVFESDFLQGAATYSSAPNVRRGSGTVIAVPEWTDANNWAAAADPNDLEGVCIGYRYGRAPELYVADDALAGSMFTNDELRIKVRFVFAVGVGDYRALYKENVA